MKKFIVTLLIIVLIAALCVAGYFIYTLNNKVNDQEKTINELKNNAAKTEEVNNKVENEIEAKDEEEEEDTDENLVKDLFLDYIEKSDKENDEKLLDYRVDSVKLLPEKEKKELIATFDDYKETDILAYVVYSVKPKDVNNTGWIAGNGEVKGDWIEGKSSCACVREEKLISGFNTGW